MAKYFKTVRFIIYCSFFLLCWIERASSYEDRRWAEISTLANALNKSLLFVKDNQRARTADMALGLSIVEGSLRWLYKNPSTRTYSVMIGDLLRLCESITHEWRFDDNKIGSLLGRRFLEISPALEAEDFKHEVLKTAQKKFPVFRSCSEVDEFTLRGTPKHSDFCILQLFDNPCNASDHCWSEETSHDSHSGYGTTHRLLYLQMGNIAHKKGKDSACDPVTMMGIKDLDMRKKELCGDILQETNYLEKNSLFLTRDLLMEQVALCGFEGYLQFAVKSWLGMLPKWQQKSGCFGLLPIERFIRSSCREFVRDDLTRSDSCHTHITAVAMSAMAFRLRAAIYGY